MDALGYAGGGILAVQMWPQIYKTARVGDASQISWSMLACNVVGLGCMAAYGLLTADTPIFSTASISLVNSLALLGLKYRYEFGRFADGRETDSGNLNRNVLPHHV